MKKMTKKNKQAKLANGYTLLAIEEAMQHASQPGAGWVSYQLSPRRKAAVSAQEVARRWHDCVTSIEAVAEAFEPFCSVVPLYTAEILTPVWGLCSSERWRIAAQGIKNTAQPEAPWSTPANLEALVSTYLVVCLCWGPS